MKLKQALNKFFITGEFNLFQFNRVLYDFAILVPTKKSIVMDLIISLNNIQINNNKLYPELTNNLSKISNLLNFASQEETNYLKLTQDNLEKFKQESQNYSQRPKFFDLETKREIAAKKLKGSLIKLIHAPIPMQNKLRAICKLAKKYQPWYASSDRYREIARVAHLSYLILALHRGEIGKGNFCAALKLHEREFKKIYQNNKLLKNNLNSLFGEIANSISNLINPEIKFDTNTKSHVEKFFSKKAQALFPEFRANNSNTILRQIYMEAAAQHGQTSPARDHNLRLAG